MEAQEQRSDSQNPPTAEGEKWRKLCVLPGRKGVIRPGCTALAGATLARSAGSARAEEGDMHARVCMQQSTMRILSNQGEGIHALVGDGYHGKQEMIQDLKCQTCGEKFTVRRDTVLYRLKSRSEQVCQALGLMAEGVDISTLERVFGVGEGTMRKWLTRAGEHAERMHTVIFEEVVFRHIQLDELWANIKCEA